MLSVRGRQEEGFRVMGHGDVELEEGEAFPDDDGGGGALCLDPEVAFSYIVSAPTHPCCLPLSRVASRK